MYQVFRLQFVIQLWL